MSSFTEGRLEPTGEVNAAGRPTFRALGATGNGIWFYVGYPASGRGVFIPEGFVTDGASYLTGTWRRRVERLRRSRLARWLLVGWVAALIGRLVEWVDACLAKAALVHDEMRESEEFSLDDSDGHFWIAMGADQPNWRGPAWAQRALRRIAFWGVTHNTSRDVHNPAASLPLRGA